MRLYNDFFNCKITMCDMKKFKVSREVCREIQAEISKENVYSLSVRGKRECKYYKTCCVLSGDQTDMLGNVLIDFHGAMSLSFAQRCVP